MAISPNQREQLAVEILRIYAESERILLEKIRRRIERGIDEPGWQERKLAEIQRMREEIQKEIQTLDTSAVERVREILEEAYQAGIESADRDLKIVTQTPVEDTNITITTTATITGSFGTINRRSLEALTNEIIGNLRASHIQVLRSANDAYYRIVSENIGTGLTGTETRRQVTQRILNDFADQGITGFVDKSKRHWEIATYAEMATRAGIARASINGHVNRMAEQGRDLVIVSDHPEECEICRPWERKILSISGNDTRYPTLNEAESAGLFHPSCGHTINAYIEGLTEIGTPKADPRGYKDRQQQRYNERMIRKWKRREVVAMSDEEKEFARRKVREWQTRNLEFTRENDRRRKYEREQINSAR